MVDFRPLEAYEYNTSIAGEIGDLIAPPYDVIDEAGRNALAAKSPYNIVHITLPQAEGGLDKYQAAGRKLHGWLEERILAPGGRAFYVIEQTFDLGGRTYIRTGILGRALLGPWRESGIYPHELTLPKPREDRFRLYKATKVVPGPSFSLFEDVSGEGRRIVGEIRKRPPYWSAQGPEGSFDRVWKITEPLDIEGISAALKGEKFFIADGHHRYETALAYRDELAARGELTPGHPASFVLMCVVPFDDEGLVVLPTHRLLLLRGERPVEAAIGALKEDYSLKHVPSLEAFEGTGEKAPSQVALYTPRQAYLLNMTEVTRKVFVGRVGRTMAAVNTFEVIEKVMPRFFRDVNAAVATEQVKYTHSLKEALERVDGGAFQAAIILAGIPVRRIAEVASSGQTMPPKSTYFYPKLPTGVAVMPLEKVPAD